MNVLVTGASRGIGNELGKFFSEKAAVLFLLSRDEKKLSELKTECEKINPKAKIVLLPFSLEDEKSFGEIKSVVDTEVNHLDILINNAGYLVNKPFAQISNADLRKVYEVNVFGPFKLIQTLSNLFGVEKKSHIVNIGSMGGVQGAAKFAGLSAYSSSKMALAGLSECLAEEFKEKNVSVNCLTLGAVETEMLSEAFPGYKAPHSAKEMASFIGHFAISAAKFMNGKIIPVAISTP